MDDVALPTRFREAQDRGERMGRLLRRVAGVREVDEALMGRIGRAMTEGDPLGTALAHAMRLPAGDPERVSRADLREGLTTGVGPDAPPALRALLDVVGTDPAWLDRDLLARGQRAYHRFGQNAADVLLQLSLVGGYRFGGPTDLLVATGGLTGGATVRRLAETQTWATALSAPGGLEPGGEAWRLTVHVRAMHALVDVAFAPRWDAGRWGRPINQADQAATLGLFDGVVLLGVRALGVPVAREDAHAVMHLWRYVGWLLGVHEDFLTDDERTRHRWNYHLLLAQAGPTDAGPLLARAVVDAQAHLTYEDHPRVRAWFERERLLSMLTVFLGARSLRELGLPRRPPWAHAYLAVLNAWRYRTPWGRRGLDAWGSRVRERVLRRYHGADERDLGPLRHAA